MTASTTTQTAATTGAAKPGLLASLFGDVSSVLKTLINSSAIAPAAKTDLHNTLDTVATAAQSLETTAGTAAEDVLADAPAEASAATTAAIGAAANAAGPVGGLIADVVEPAASAEASSMMSKFITTFEKHNSALMNDLAEIAAGGNPSSAA